MARTTVSSLRASIDALELDTRDLARAGESAFSEQIKALVSRADLEVHLERHKVEGAVLSRAAELMAKAAFEHRDPRALLETHRALYALYEDGVKPAGKGGGLNQFNPYLITLRNKIERCWEKFELDRITLSPEDVPADREGFRAFFVSTCWDHPMIGHRLFDYLANEATRGELIDFFLNDGAVIVRFCDLVAMSMVGVDDDVRPELANNFWDEMGNGKFQERHVQLYRDLLAYTGCNVPSEDSSTEHFVDHLDWSGLAGYNFYLLMCLHRRNQFRALGALGAAEMTDPPQYERVLIGCRRVGLDDDQRLAYYTGHQTADVAHGAAWLENVLLPLVAKYPERRHEIVAGALMRMNITRDYYDNLLEGLRRGVR